MNRSSVAIKLEKSHERLDEIRRIARNYSTLVSTSHVLGNAPSAYMGRGHDFGELRQYSYGQDARDIDWKASARSGELLVRKYVEEHERRVLIACPVGKSILGDSSAGEPKADIAAQIIGSIAYISREYGDRFAFFFDTPVGLYRSEFRSGMSFMEDNLALFERSCASAEKKTPLGTITHRILTETGKRLLVFLVGDEVDFLEGGMQGAFNLMRAGYDVRALAFDDACLFGDDTYNLDNSHYLDFIPVEEMRKIREAEYAEHMKMSEKLYYEMDRNGIKFAVVPSAKMIPEALLTVLAGKQEEAL